MVVTGPAIGVPPSCVPVYVGVKFHGGEKGEGFTISGSVSLDTLGSTLSETQTAVFFHNVTFY